MPSSTDGQKSRVLLVGSGAIGTMAAYALEQGGLTSVTAVARSSFKIVSTHGFNIKSIEHGEVKNWSPTSIVNKVPNVKEESLAPFDFVLVATKNVPDVPPRIAEIIAPAVTPGHTAILLIQNGLNIEKPVYNAFPTNPVLSGITMMAAQESSPGFIEHNNYDISFIGAFDTRNGTIEPGKAIAAAKRFVELYSACAVVNCNYDADVAHSRWKKLLYNASYNGVATILRMDTSRMRAGEHIIDELIKPVMREIQAIAFAAAGVVLPDALIDKIITADLYKTFFKPSMCQDIEKGNFIEFENLVGEPLRVAGECGVDAPYLKVLYALLKGLQFQVKEAKGLVEVPKESSPEMKYGDKERGWA